MSSGVTVGAGVAAGAAAAAAAGAVAAGAALNASAAAPDLSDLNCWSVAAVEFKRLETEEKLSPEARVSVVAGAPGGGADAEGGAADGAGAPTDAV